MRELLISECRQLHNIAREPGVFEWRIYPGHTTAQFLDEVQKMQNIDRTHPINLNGRIVVMSMYNDIGWDKKRHEEVCKRNVASAPANTKLFPEVRWTFLEPRDEKMVRDSLSRT